MAALGDELATKEAAMDAVNTTGFRTVQSVLASTSAAAQEGKEQPAAEIAKNGELSTDAEASGSSSVGVVSGPEETMVTADKVSLVSWGEGSAPSLPSVDDDPLLVRVSRHMVLSSRARALASWLCPMLMRFIRMRMTVTLLSVL